MIHRCFNTLVIKTLACCFCALTVDAQMSSPDASTIRVYVNRMQIPVLLLDSFRHPAELVPASRFQVILEGVPPFAPSDVRLEGDDPISLAVLLDRSDADEFLWDKLGNASGQLARSLHPGDSVEVYGIDGCKLRRFGTAGPPEQARLQTELEAAAAVKPYSKVRKQQGLCVHPVSLWDAMYYVGGMLENRSGRRVVLALTNGQASGPKEQMDGLHRLLNAESISVFAVRHGEPGFASFMLQVDQGRILKGGDRASAGNAPMNMTGDLTWGGYPLAVEAEASGGMVMSATIQSLQYTLAEVIARVRGRYIVEFPRPAGLTAGTRAISVSIGKTHDFIRPAGISVPPGSPEERAKVVALDEAEGEAPVEEPVALMPAEAKTPTPGKPNVLMNTSTDRLAAAETVPVRAPDPLDITDEAKPVVSSEH